MHVHARLGFILALFGMSASQAATEFESAVPVDLARYLTGGGVSYRDLPADFPPFAMPAGLLPIGSQDSVSQQLVLLRTSRSGADSQAAVVAALEAGGGWQTLAPAGSQRQNGFIVPVTSLQPVTLCHADYGNLEIRGEDGTENRVYIRRYDMRPGSTTSCEEQNQRRLGNFSARTDPAASLFQYMPRLEPAAPPANATAPGARAFFTDRPYVFMAGSGASGMATEFTVPAAGSTAGEAIGQFSGQLRAQGWEPDTAWAANSAAGSNWTRSPVPDLHLFLALTALKTEQQSYTIKVNLVEVE